MRTINLCRRRLDVARLMAIKSWAERLEADECIIHCDGSITLTCADGYICNGYKPTGKELYGGTGR